jgi:hypothetical protein
LKDVTRQKRGFLLKSMTFHDDHHTGIPACPPDRAGESLGADWWRLGPGGPYPDKLMVGSCHIRQRHNLKSSLQLLYSTYDHIPQKSQVVKPLSSSHP